MRGTTNALPAGGGGLKVVASGATSSGSITFPSPVSILFLNIPSYNGGASLVVLPIGQPMSIIVSGYQTPTVLGTATLSSNGLILTTSSDAEINYLALG